MSYRVIAGEQVEGENSTKFVNELTRVSWVGRTDIEKTRDSSDEQLSPSSE
jgi:hypothetical protein